MQADLHRVVVTALIHRMRDRTHAEVLVMKRPADARFFPGVWVAPGGGVEHADMAGTADGFANRALLRELREELGAAVEVERPYWRGHRAFVREDGTGVVVLTATCQWIRGDPVVTEEAVDFAWLAASEVGHYDLIGDTALEILDACGFVEPF